MPENLWPDFEPTYALRTPKVVIEEAGAGLEEKTKGTVKFFRSSTGVKGGDVQFSYTLYAPLLGYHYPFLRAAFPLNGFYPVKLVADKLPDAVASDEKELVVALGRIFREKTTVETIQRLISLAK